MALFKSTASGADPSNPGFKSPKNEGFGSSDPGSQDWTKMKGGAKNEYWKLKGQLLYDPALMQLGENAQRDYRGLGQSIAMGQADQASNSVSQALAARGGGNIASSLTMGAQGRIGAGLQGLQMGMGMEQNALGTYLQAKWGALAGLFGTEARIYGVDQAADASKYSSDMSYKSSWVPSFSANKEL